MKIIILSKGEECIVDDEDYEYLSQFKWTSNKKISGVYAYRYERYGLRKENKRISIPMHREILKTPKGMQTDHINGNTLDNRKCNLRICNHSDNAKNTEKMKKPCTSKYKGICWDKSRKKWQASLNIDKKVKFIGRFENELDAAKAYNNAVLKYNKEFGRINKIKE